MTEIIRDNMTTSHCTKLEPSAEDAETTRGNMLFSKKKHDTHGKVYSHQLVVLEKQSAKRRRLFLWQVKE